MKRIALNTIIVVATVAALVVAWKLRTALLIFCASLAAAAALRPVAQRMIRLGVGRRVALALTYASLVGILLVLVATIADPIADDLARATNDFRQGVRQLSAEWSEGSPLQRAIVRRLPQGDGDRSAPAIGWTRPLVEAGLGTIELGIQIAVILVLSLYWSLDRVHFERLWLSFLPVDRRPPARDIWRNIELESGAYLRSEVVQSLAAGWLLYLGYRLLGAPYPALTAMICGAAWFIPWAGALIAVFAVAGLAMLPALAGNGPPLEMAGWSLIYTLAVLVILEFVVEPLMFDRRRFNSLWIALFVLGLGEQFGVVGIIVAPPLAAALQILGTQLLEQHTAVRHARPADTSLAERLQTLQGRLQPQGRPDLESLAARLEKLLDEAESVWQVGRDPRQPPVP